VTKAKAYKGASRKTRPRVTFHAHGSVGGCEGMNPHTPKWDPIWGIGVPMDSWIFREQFQGSKLIKLKRPLYHWKALGTYMSKMFFHDPFRYLKHKLLPKKGWESNYQFESRPLKVSNRFDLIACRWCATYRWNFFNEGYNFVLNLTSIKGLHKELWASKVARVPILGISGLPTWESWDKMTFGCSPHG
jgi:hypothetical protein